MHVEKGIEEGAEDPSQKMLPNWEWHRFVPALTTGTFSKAVETAAKAIGQPLQIDIVGKMGDQEEEFSANTVNGTLTDVTTILSPGIKAFRHLRGCTSLTELGTQLSGDVRKALSWGWIDVYVSAAFELVGTGTDDIVRCARMLEPFEPWVHDGKRK